MPFRLPTSELEAWLESQGWLEEGQPGQFFGREEGIMQK